MADWAVQNRLARLSSDSGFFQLLALDHGLTFGSIPNLPPQDRIATLCASGAFTGVVLNLGMLRRLVPGQVPPVILQTTSGTIDSSMKHPTWTAGAAARAGADAIALDLLLGVKPDFASQSIRFAADLIESAHSLGMPALVMVRAFTRDQRSSPLMASIRTAVELGADVVKIGASGLDAFTEEEEPGLANLLKQSPPVVIAGGDTSGPPVERLVQEAIAVGFRGYCVGRQIFASADPQSLALILD